MNQIKNKLLVLFLLVSLFSSCYEHEEGCRDINALNFDVAADKDCENNCCKYPDVYINFRLTNDSITVDTNTILANNLNDTIRIKYFRMYLSGFKIINTHNDTLILLNKIQTGTDEDGKTEYKYINFTVAKVKAKSQTYNLGNLTKLDNYNEFIFDFGIDSLVNHSILDKVNISNPLSIKDNDMYISTSLGYYFLKMEIEMPDNTIKYVYISGDKFQSTISINKDLDLRERTNHYIDLDLDISKWLLPVDLNKKDDELKAILLHNLNKSMIIR